MERHRAKTLGGLLARLAAKVAVYTCGPKLNAQLGRPLGHSADSLIRTNAQQASERVRSPELNGESHSPQRLCRGPSAASTPVVTPNVAVLAWTDRRQRSAGPVASGGTEDSPTVGNPRGPPALLRAKKGSLCGAGEGLESRPPNASDNAPQYGPTPGRYPRVWTSARSA